MRAKLTDDQKQHLRMAHRAQERIQETWILFQMYLSQDKRPAEALNLAQEAASVWADWQDAHEIEPPDIEHPDFGADLKEVMDGFAGSLAKSGPFRQSGGAVFEIVPDGIQAEFLPEHPERPNPLIPAEPPMETKES